MFRKHLICQGNDAPDWVRLMYEDDATPEVVRSAFEAHYENVPFVKNRDTQYYKRWMRNHELTASSALPCLCGAAPSCFGANEWNLGRNGAVEL
jgi:hypothetical protein